MQLHLHSNYLVLDDELICVGSLDVT
ncbi:hypothetical protein ACLKMH_12075 [Psychromonas sp. KJ10-10]